MKIFNLIAFLLVTGFAAHAQKYELGEVTKEELEQKSHPTDPSASAAILFSKGTTYMDYSASSGFMIVTEVDTKIKIYNKDGYDWANKIISYYSSDNGDETVDVNKAVTYNLADGKVVKTKLKKEGEFTEQVNKFYKQRKIMMPDVKEGSIVEYRYTVRSPFISLFPEWRFQEPIPVNYSEYTTRIPEYFTYKPNFRGYLAPKVSNSAANKRITYVEKERTGRGTQFSNGQIDYSEKVATYVMENVPALKDEYYVNNIDNYTSSIEHELAITQYPGETVKSYSHSWEDLAKTIYNYDDFGGEIKRTGYYEDDLNALLSGADTQEKKIGVIFSYVKNRMNWNSYYGYTCHDGVKQAYKNKTGNVAEINLMLVSMLNYAGLEANPVLVTTRSSKIALFPTRSAFNYVIAAVQVGNEIVLLDATSKSALPNILPVRSLNWNGRLIRKDGSSLEISMFPQSNSKELITIIAAIDEEGKVSGKARDQYFDYNAFIFRESHSNSNLDSYLEKLEKRYDGIEIENYSVTNDDLNKPVVEEFNFVHNNISDIIGDKIYVHPLLFFAETENPFKQEKREYPIDFVYPRQDRYMITLSIPEGYVVESIPESLALGMEQNIGSFKFSIQANEKQIQLIATTEINYSNIPQDYYTVIKDFYQKMVEKQTEKIVLSKKI
ncbi:DUF3857 domain-containing protein [Flavobacterium alkalisoli]|uniref:DUF3857 domain-containing protein n=1 Tax=Flavobacterium alkalisoli TaxID=2602769 RepID=A0A5B9FQP7_9FLAO|nr:DUF3857 domain-containing protein [Flavobacterium alkalisoli]QEE49284.1 DUF3857 domain-containing protein [Flavobacterium alkalisoli]